MREPLSLEGLQSGVIDFLISPAILNGDGTVWSWINPAHPGFVYPEAMGLHLRLMSQLAASRRDARIEARCHEVARGLVAVTPPIGGVGMDGNLYLFDTCMAIGGLAAYRRLLGGRVDPDTFARMAAFVGDLTRRRLALVDGNGGAVKAPHHWSTIYGAHMLKTVIALDAIGAETGDPRWRATALEIADEVIAGCRKDDAFRIGPTDTVVYCHAHCYALEGLLYLRAKGLRETTPMLRAGADRLRDWQNEDGSLYNWYEDPARTRSKVGDATSQATRIWLAVDAVAYAPNVEKALGFLASLRSPIDGLFYASGSLDVNSITSVFAAQAMEWRLRGANPEWLA